jgi:hypothetical protein
MRQRYFIKSNNRASFLTQDYISYHYDKNYDIKSTEQEHVEFINKMSVLFNGTDLSEYLSNFLEGKT